ncbi:MAG TPA: hypothetical protein VGL87_10650 [Steroidobacteraceae bacterium]
MGALAGAPALAGTLWSGGTLSDVRSFPAAEPLGVDDGPSGTASGEAPPAGGAASAVALLVARSTETLRVGAAVEVGNPTVSG